MRTNDEWLAAFDDGAALQEEAIADLRDYLLRAVFVYLSRKRSDLAHLDSAELEQLAQDCVQDALTTILLKREQFRGRSKFTTWAYRIVINEAAARLRGKAWKQPSLDALTSAGNEGAVPQLIADGDADDPERAARQAEAGEVLRRALDEDLTPWQREVLTSVVLAGEAPVAAASRLGTTRNNIYKVLHDARRRLHHGLASRGLTADDILACFTIEASPAMRRVPVRQPPRSRGTS